MELSALTEPRRHSSALSPAPLHGYIIAQTDISSKVSGRFSLFILFSALSSLPRNSLSRENDFHQIADPVRQITPRRFALCVTAVSIRNTQENSHESTKVEFG